MQLAIGKYAFGWGLGFDLFSYGVPTFELRIKLYRFYIHLSNYKKK